MNKILIIEDDPDIVSLLEIHLKDHGYSSATAFDGKKGLAMARADQYDLIILDLNLPGMDGLEICRILRVEQKGTPVMMLTARSEEIDKVLGLEMGADDYLTKPFSVREFLARVKSIIRRSEVWKSTEENSRLKQKLEFGDLSIDLEKRAVNIKSTRIDLSPKEFELLSLLASHPGKSFDRSRLLNLVWGYDFDGYEHTVNSHINRLRRKIEPDMNKPSYILTSWGIGYRFNENA